MSTKHYRSEKETIIEALEDVESFITKMDLFKTSYPAYRYTVEIKPYTNTRSKYKWVVNLNVIKDEEPSNTEVA